MKRAYLFVLFLCVATDVFAQPRLVGTAPRTLFTNLKNKLRLGIQATGIHPLATNFVLIKNDSNYFQDTAWRVSEEKNLDYVIRWRKAPSIALDSTSIPYTVIDPTTGFSVQWKPILSIHYGPLGHIQQ